MDNLSTRKSEFKYIKQSFMAPGWHMFSLARFLISILIKSLMITYCLQRQYFCCLYTSSSQTICRTFKPLGNDFGRLFDIFNIILVNFTLKMGHNYTNGCVQFISYRDCLAQSSVSNQSQSKFVIFCIYVWLITMIFDNVNQVQTFERSKHFYVHKQSEVRAIQGV